MSGSQIIAFAMALMMLIGTFTLITRCKESQARYACEAQRGEVCK